jgi:hypothetical protein
MKPKLADCLDFAKIGLLVGVIMLVLYLSGGPFLGTHEFVRTILLILLFFPWAVPFIPLIRSVHNFWGGYLYIGAAINWFLYTWWAWSLVEKRRRKRELRRARPRADVVPPDRLPPDQSAK